MERKTTDFKSSQSPKRHGVDRLKGDTIILDGQGHFPKNVIIIETGKTRKYQIKKTKNGKYLFN